MSSSDTHHIISTDTKEIPTWNKKNSSFLELKTHTTQSALLRNSLIFLVVLTSMTQLYLLGSILSTQATVGDYKDGTEDVQKTSSSKEFVNQRKQSGISLKPPAKISPPQNLKKPYKKGKPNTRTRTRTKNARTPRAHRLTGI